MRKIYFLFAVILMTSTLAIAQNSSSEKGVDKSEYVVMTKSANQSGDLGAADPTYNRIYGSPYDGTCNVFANLSGSGTATYYDVYEIHTTTSEAADISISSASFSDSYMTLYCSFDPLNPDQGVFCGDDDDGSGFLSAFLPSDGYMLDANTSYYLVITSFSNGTTGSYTVDMGGNLQFGPPPAPPTVPLSNWAFAIIGILALSFVFIKFRK